MPDTGVATDLFLALTPERVLSAVEAGGLAVNPVCYPLNSFENRVYEVELADRSRVVAKFYRPGRWSEEQIQEEHQFLADLAAAELPVCTMREFPGGGTLRRIENIWYSLADRRGGRAPDELDGALAERLGMIVARLHNVGAQRDAPHRIRFEPGVYVREELAWMETHAVVPRALAGRYFAAAHAIADLAERALAGVPVHRIHADLHLGNLLLREERGADGGWTPVLRLLDFDDMAVGPAVQDLWLALPGRDPWTLSLRERFLAGYERFRAFDRATLTLVEPLRGMRIIHYAAWLARRWHDPAFPAAWPHFGTEDYWQRETADLEEQLAAIRGELAPEEAPAEEPELTNKDYFWDWEGS